LIEVEFYFYLRNNLSLIILIASIWSKVLVF